ncbi:unnamed protein product [Lathyrus sativus]|nr:unnamed protein product [Lathyrus sativus]
MFCARCCGNHGAAYCWCMVDACERFCSMWLYTYHCTSRGEGFESFYVMLCMVYVCRGRHGLCWFLECCNLVVEVQV